MMVFFFFFCTTLGDCVKEKCKYFTMKWLKSGKTSTCTQNKRQGAVTGFCIYSKGLNHVLSK